MRSEKRGSLGDWMMPMGRSRGRARTIGTSRLRGAHLAPGIVLCVPPATGTKHAQPLSPQQLSWREVEGRLREWAETPGVLGREAQTLRDAAETLTHWRAQEPSGNLP